jgi:hypothetical protein
MTPTLKQTMMQMSMPGVVGSGKEKKRVPRLCLLWEEVGLAIHMNEHKTWNISHFLSGRSALRLIKTKDKAVEYMYKLHEYLAEWTFTEEDFDKWKVDFPEESLALKNKVDELQRQIYQESSL